MTWAEWRKELVNNDQLRTLLMHRGISLESAYNGLLLYEDIPLLMTLEDTTYYKIPEDIETLDDLFELVDLDFVIEEI